MATQLEPLLPRGVFKALYTVKGFEVLVAIDSRGDVRKHLKIIRPGDEPRLKLVLEELLDMLDPQLKLVRAERVEPGFPYDGSAAPKAERSPTSPRSLSRKRRIR